MNETTRSIVQENNWTKEKLFPADILPTRKFVAELQGYQMKVPESKFVGRGYQMRRVTYPNWVGIIETARQKITTEIKAYYAITRFTFKTEKSYEEWMLSEEGGRGFELTLYGKGADTEAIVKAFLEGADFYAFVPYRERKRVSYACRWPEPNHIFPVVTLNAIDFESDKGKNVQKALEMMEKFKRVLLNAKPDTNFSRYYNF